jgi:hypothetical protein
VQSAIAKWSGPIGGLSPSGSRNAHREKFGYAPLEHKRIYPAEAQLLSKHSLGKRAPIATNIDRRCRRSDNNLCFSRRDIWAIGIVDLRRAVGRQLFDLHGDIAPLLANTADLTTGELRCRSVVTLLMNPQPFTAGFSPRDNSERLGLASSSVWGCSPTRNRPGPQSKKTSTSRIYSRPLVEVPRPLRRQAPTRDQSEARSSAEAG